MGIVKSREKPGKYILPNIFHYHVVVPFFSTGWEWRVSVCPCQREGLCRKKTSPPMLVVYPYRPRVWTKFGAFPTWILGWKWQNLANLRCGSSRSSFLSPFSLSKITSKLPGQKNTPSARCISGYKKWWFSNLSFVRFPRGGGNRVSQYLLLVQVKEFNEVVVNEKNPLLFCSVLSFQPWKVHFDLILGDLYRW